MTTEKMLSFSVFVVRLANVKVGSWAERRTTESKDRENASSKNKGSDSGRGGENGLPARVLRR